MIKIKDVIWECKKSEWTNDNYYSASVKSISFLTIYTIDCRFYIHTHSPLIYISGNKGIDEWGWFDDIDVCKFKAEEIISDAILSMIDVRDNNINIILDGN